MRTHTHTHTHTYTHTHTTWQLAKELGIKRVVLINDFVAQGYGLLTVDRKDSKQVRVLQVSKPLLTGWPACCA